MKAPKIEDVAVKVRNRTGNYGVQKYACKFCDQHVHVYYSNFKPLRAHMLRYHRMEYYATVPFVIEEERWLVA